MSGKLGLESKEYNGSYKKPVDPLNFFLDPLKLLKEPPYRFPFINKIVPDPESSHEIAV